MVLVLDDGPRKVCANAAIWCFTSVCLGNCWICLLVAATDDCQRLVDRADWIRGEGSNDRSGTRIGAHQRVINSAVPHPTKSCDRGLKKPAVWRDVAPRYQARSSNHHRWKVLGYWRTCGTTQLRLPRPSGILKPSNRPPGLSIRGSRSAGYPGADALETNPSARARCGVASARCGTPF